MIDLLNLCKNHANNLFAIDELSEVHHGDRMCREVSGSFEKAKTYFL